MAGATGSNDCPAGSVRIETEAACRTALAAWGRTMMEPSFPMSVGPRGCSYFIPTLSDIAFFNTDPVGMGNPGVQLLCHANGTTGALQPHRCACACVTYPLPALDHGGMQCAAMSMLIVAATPSPTHSPTRPPTRSPMPSPTPSPTPAPTTPVGVSTLHLV
jgi:hypothetical protein